MADQLGVLSVGCHRKDPIIHSGGALAKHVARGDRVSILSVTHGVRTHHLRAKTDIARNPEYVPDMDALIKEIEDELTAAADELGITDVRCLRHDDEILTVSREIVSDIADVICDFRPDVVITHWPYDGHSAHGVAGQMTQMAIVAAASIRADRSQRSHGIKALYYHVPVLNSTIVDSLAPKPLTTFVDITDVIQQKYRALNHFRHQYYGGDDPFNRGETERLDGLYGLAAQVPYVEPYILHKPAVFDHLPVGKYQMEVAPSSQEEVLRYSGRMLLER